MNLFVLLFVGLLGGVLIVAIALMLRTANHNPGGGARLRRGEQADESRVVHTGRGVLKVIAFTAVIALVFLVVLGGTCLIVIRW
ncbi:MAG: hypothetical protein WCP31_02995 [Chloroflexales bacterium]